MREAKLYIVDERDVIVHGDVYHFYQANTVSPYVADNMDVLHTIEKIAAPVHQICHIEAGKYKDSYIALDPLIKEIIESPLLEKIHYLHNRLSSADNLCTLYENRIGEYNSLPWYKRIFKKA